MLNSTERIVRSEKRAIRHTRNGERIMADNRKYYYLKLKENYFDEDAVVLLESMQDGIVYSNILLKLYLKSLKNGGKAAA